MGEDLVCCEYVKKVREFTYWWMCPWLCPPVFWLQSHRAGRQFRLLHSSLQDHKAQVRISVLMMHFVMLQKIKRVSGSEMWYHTDEVVPHLIQYRLHVRPGQALGPHQALQHSKHAPDTATFFGAEINKTNVVDSENNKKKTHMTAHPQQCNSHFLTSFCLFDRQPLSPLLLPLPPLPPPPPSLHPHWTHSPQTAGHPSWSSAASPETHPGQENLAPGFFLWTWKWLTKTL